MMQRTLFRVVTFGLLTMMFASIVFSQQKEKNRNQQSAQNTPATVQPK